MKKQFLFLLLAVILLSSCATATLSEFPGVGRVKQYDFYSYDIPPAFDGFRIGFASDFHYESRYRICFPTTRTGSYNNSTLSLQKR